MPNIFKNFKEPISTIIGLIIIIASIASVFFEIAGWDSATLGITAGVGLLFMKDKYDGGTLKTIVLAILISLAFYSCIRPSRAPIVVYETLRDSTSEKVFIVRDTLYIKEDSVGMIASLNELDSIVTLSKADGSRKYLRTETKGRAKIKVFAEKGRVFIEGNCDSLSLVNTQITKEIKQLRNRLFLPEKQSPNSLWGDWPYQLVIYVFGLICGALITIIYGKL